MNLPEIKPYEEQAIDTVVSVINRAKEKLGIRLTLRELAHSRDILTTQPKVSLTALRTPLAITSEEFISETIEKQWHLTKTFSYILKYMGASQDECSQYYYFEVEENVLDYFSTMKYLSQLTIMWATCRNILEVMSIANKHKESKRITDAVFSQPTAAYPIPQATVSVFFRVQKKYTEPPEMRGVPLMTFRIEGQDTDHDVRYVKLIADWILAVIKMKTKLFNRIEKIRLF